MVNVSDRFIELAQKNGRSVWCRIVADGVEFLDDRIIDMDFDDVVHPDWFTIGTACANRLHFTAAYSGELSTGAEVRASISFDGEEWCPLGVFYIARRYVRGNYISVTAYDKMYSLDTDYRYFGELPVNSRQLLTNVCEAAGLECADTGISQTIETVPEGCTVRDMLGYIAGINCASAKIDRYGRFVMKRSLSAIDFELQDRNCWEVQRNMGRSVVTCVKINTGDGELQAGNGAQISTVEQYNPLATQAMADAMYSMFKPFSYFGAELHMQGMPFLEAGDMLHFLDGKMLYGLVISEIEYSYNGGLSAVLYSRTRVNDEEPGDLEKLLEQLLHTKNAVYYRRVNKEQIAVKDAPQIIADFEFESTEDCFAQLDVNLTAKESTADHLIFLINVNGADVPRKIVQTMREGSNLIHVYHLAEKLPAGKNRIYVTARTKTGDAYIGAGDMLATVVGHGIYGNSGSQRDKLSLYEKTERWSMLQPYVGALQISSDMNKEVT